MQCRSIRTYVEGGLLLASSPAGFTFLVFVCSLNINELHVVHVEMKGGDMMDVKKINFTSILSLFLQSIQYFILLNECDKEQKAR